MYYLYGIHSLLLQIHTISAFTALYNDSPSLELLHGILGRKAVCLYIIKIICILMYLKFPSTKSSDTNDGTTLYLFYIVRNGYFCSFSVC